MTIKIVLFLAKCISITLGYLFYYLFPIRKNVQLKNLNIAFPHYSKDEINRIARINYIEVFHIFIEVIFLRFISKENVKKMILFNADFNNLIDKYPGKLMFLTGHLGNWEVAGLSGALNLNRKFSVLAKKQASGFAAKFIKDTRELYGNKEIYTGANIKELLNALNREEIVAIVADQRGPRESIKINFFNHPTSVQIGFAKIALKTNTPIILGAAVRQNNNLFKIEFEEIDYINYDGSEDEKIIYILNRYYNFLEKLIKINPEQYFWLHNLWKY